MTAKLFLDLDMEQLKDDTFGILRDTVRLFNKYGFYKVDVLEQ